MDHRRAAGVFQGSREKT